MLYLNKQIIIALAFCFFLTGTKVLACECGVLSPENAVERSTVVFTGKVVGFKYRKGIPNQLMESLEKDSGKHIDYETMVVKIQVERWWKGEASAGIILLTSRTRNADGTSSSSSCDYDFTKGETYLIYASGEKSELRTNFCMRTRKLSEAKEDLEILGEGKEPFRNESQAEQVVIQAKNRSTMFVTP